ncbi:ubiquitin fusion degradation protein [Apophysomyces ossiformis]|uniref:Ubiquitin fusion degradation protein n=1 Tax=Apophysomyces ossiformis TaxID=679940 RepID=A0A8H7BJG2_9FUNG|nr:ubiquitin fusion degradation protein [Apophysomyces ossiformis]
MNGIPQSFFDDFHSPMGFVNPHQGFSEYYRCYPIAMMQQGNERENVNYGGKIILPQSALEKLSQLHISYPMLFQLSSPQGRTHTHAGVLEFIAEEGRVYLPQWAVYQMMETLRMEPGGMIIVKNTTLPLGSFVKIQPQSTNFLDISDHRAVLENALRNFSTLTLGDVIQINYNDKVYEIQVLDVKPNFEDHSGISIVETDLEVDFAPPVGYVEPSSRLTPTPSMKSQMVIEEPQPAKNEFEAFQGSGRSLRAKGKDDTTNVDMNGNEPGLDGNDDGPFNLPLGHLYFGFPVIAPKSGKDEDNEGQSHIFSGVGQTLRGKKSSAKGT